LLADFLKQRSQPDPIDGPTVVRDAAFIDTPIPIILLRLGAGHAWAIGVLEE
jgi:hypothetical protein